MNLICNLPAERVYVRKEYLQDHQSGHGEFVEGVWVSAKSIPGRAFYFETYLPQYGAIYDKLPISAFVRTPNTPDPDLDLPNLQFWNCMDYGVACMNKGFISSMDAEVFSRDHGFIKGQYLFTLDNYHANPDVVDNNVSEVPQEHKSHNCIELENGQFALYPNNRMRLYDLSITPEKPLMPDFKVSTVEYQVENGVRWGRLGDTDDYYWQTEEEKTSLYKDINY
ncbi:MAG: phosphoribosylaminoimidazole synthetase [Candidatus Thorarchaeota archaeon]|jgi:hypothetical protein